MNEQSFLTFTLNDSLYGIDTFSVEEIFSLPELTPIPEAPRDIVGVVNVRGYILPVMDINLRFRFIAPDYHLTDSVIVLKSGDLRIGIIVNQVQEVRNIGEEEISSEISLGREIKTTERKKFISGIARNGEDILILLNPENLIRYVETEDISATAEDIEIHLQDTHHADEHHGEREHEHEFLEKRRIFCPNATPEERAVFHKRAENLRQALETEDSTGLKPLAVVILNKEFFGVDLNLVREFTDIRQVTPIPCCPPYIIGNMNLRGEILTLVDVRELLNLPFTGMGDASKAIVVQVEGIVTGFKVEEVYDVMFLNPQDITTVPTAIHSVNDEYLQGATPYQGKMMSILDVPKILLNGGLIVDEAV